MLFVTNASVFSPLRLKAFFISSILILKFIGAHSQSEDNYSIKHYTSKNGLPQNSIRSMVMDEDRYLWMTTEGGLVRFDGQHFKIYNHFNLPEIKNDRFRSIVKTYDGRILATDLAGALFGISSGKIELLRQGDPIRPPNRLYFGGVPDEEFMINRLQNKPDSNLENPSDPLYTYIYSISPNRYVTRTRGGISIINFNKVEKEIKIPVKSTEEILFIFGNHFYYYNNIGKFFYVDIETGLSQPVIFSGAITSDSIQKYIDDKKLIWNYNYSDVHIKLQNRLYKFEKGKDPAHINCTYTLSGLPDNCNISDAFFDAKSQNYFIGTDTKGLYIYKQHSMKTLSYRIGNKITNTAFYSQCALDSNTILTPADLEFTLSGGVPSKILKSQASSESMYTDSSGNVWYVIGNKILSYNIHTQKTLTIECPGETGFYCFYPEADTIFVVWDTGLGFIKKNQYFPYATFERKSIEARIETMERGPDGYLWVGMCSGVGRFNPVTKKIETIDQLNDICARAFFRDHDKMFIGTYGHGFYCWEKGKVTRFPLDKDKILSYAHSFFVDNNDNMWISTNKGLFKISYKNILAYIEHSEQSLHYQYFGEDDGIANTEFNGGCVPPVLRLKNGYVSYPTMEGLVWLRPEEINNEAPDEVITIDAIMVDGKEIEQSEKMIIPSRHENITIMFSSPYWGNPYNFNIEYQLSGLNKSWVEVNSSANSLPFSTLSSGSYELRIRKRNFNDEFPFVYATLKFEVEKKYYETTLFIIISTLASLGFFISIVKMNSRRIVQKNIDLENRIAERTHELALANTQLEENVLQLSEKEKNLKENIHLKDRLISVISHDIITPLKFISVVSRISKKNPSMIDKKKLVESMNDIEFASDKLFNNANNIMNWMKLQNKRIKPKLDHIAVNEFVDELIEPLTGMAEIKGIKINNNVPDEDLIVSDKYILMIILQNLLSNAIKYSEQGEITFSAWEEVNQYSISVTDCGIGMPQSTLKEIENIINTKEALESEPDFENGNRLGYYIIADFLYMLKGSMILKSELGKGTTVTIQFPQNHSM